ncbi:HlyD family secretion protein [Janthinobacterium psychrotolerans]|uniref:Membrane fusion protein n=1 Tax=Janthinobacterium psychrotolerans TaxID=1747903 RepID=A0A1A7C0Y8_9BURK|nr:HlyD family efflux transporter periplasmic adaptor subunit [Janthinobacterium psychrotolerans]OBV38400.1 membrane fusion protein [Janthinobacterium psychrotolerans]
MEPETLFRPEIFKARQVSWMGDIIIARSNSAVLLTSLAALVGITILTFLFCAGYTKRVTVSGQLLPDTGLVKIYATQHGVVLEKRVAEGQAVKRGDVLYVLSSDRQDASTRGVQESISRQVGLRQQLLREEASKTRQLQSEDRSALSRKVASLADEVAKLDSLIGGQRSRVSLANQTVTRYQGLVAQGFVAQEQLQQKQGELLDQQTRLQSLERDKISTVREWTTQNTELSSIALRQQNALLQIERNIASTEEEYTESEGKRSIMIAALQDGIASGVNVDVGQTVEVNKPLVSIIPAGAKLQAVLYAPSSAIGFVKPGDTASIRYEAYPYQKFGHAKGLVQSISKAAIPVSEIVESGNLPGLSSAKSTDSLYKITVAIDAQTIMAYGQPQQLQAGMAFDADILQQTRTLFEWAMEPLYSLTGKL